MRPRETVLICRRFPGRALISLTVLVSCAVWITTEITSLPSVTNMRQSALKDYLRGVQYKTGNTGLRDKACPVDCVPELPCQYTHEVDFRIIVLTMDRPDSLAKCLNAVSTLDTLSDTVHVNIWVDRFKNASVDSKTVKVAESFVDMWQHKLKKGSACVSVQPRNAYINLQWVNTWRPRNNTKEIALILEDDVDISSLTYKWLKLAHKHYGNDFRVTGYAIQGHHLVSFGTKEGIRVRKELRGAKTDIAFYWPFMKTWGFSPNAQNWRYFQEWYVHNRWDKAVKPYVDKSITTSWYQASEKKGTEAAHWEQWHHYYSNLHKFYSVINNFAYFTDEWLASNRMESGLHFGDYKRHGYDYVENKLLKKWRKEFEEFPKHTTHIDMYGNKVNGKI